MSHRRPRMERGILRNLKYFIRKKSIGKENDMSCGFKYEADAVWQYSHIFNVTSIIPSRVSLIDLYMHTVNDDSADDKDATLADLFTVNHSLNWSHHLFIVPLY